jgi:hypothetical protein
MTITFLAPDGVELSAQRFRQAHAPLFGGGSGRRLGGRSGFRVDTPSNVLTVTSTTWTLVPCAVEIDPGASTHQGMYGWATDANVSGGVTAADSTYGRKDIVFIRINDSSAGDGSGAMTAPVEYLAGVPSDNPAAPVLPARSFLVGTINVPIAGGGSPTVVRNPAVFVAAGGILPVWSQGEFDALIPFEGFTVRRMDLTGAPLVIYRSGSWSTDLRGVIADLTDTTTSTGLDGVGRMGNAVTVTLVAGRRYRAVYRFAARSSEASLGVLVSIRTSATGDTSAAGTVIPFDQTIYTAARTSSWGGHRVEVTWTQGASTTVSLKSVLARLVGAAAYDIADRVLYVEDLGVA